MNKSGFHHKASTAVCECELKVAEGQRAQEFDMW